MEVAAVPSKFEKNSGYAQSRLVFIVLIGIPASGKSVLAWELVKYFRIHVPGSTVLRVSYDELIPEVSPTVWKKQREDVFAAVLHTIGHYHNFSNPDEKIQALSSKILMLNGLDHSSFPSKSDTENCIVIMDDNFYYRSMRYEIHRSIALLNGVFIQIYIQVSLEQALQRNHKRVSSVAAEVVERMHGLLEAPDSQKFLFERFSISTSSSPWTEDTLRSILNLVFYACSQPPVSADPVETAEISQHRLNSQTETKRSIIHKVDCILRGLVKQKCESAITSGVGNVSTFTRTYNDARKEVLNVFRSSDLQYYEIDSSSLFADVTKRFIERITTSE